MGLFSKKPDKLLDVDFICDDNYIYSKHKNKIKVIAHLALIDPEFVNLFKASIYLYRTLIGQADGWRVMREMAENSGATELESMARMHENAARLALDSVLIGLAGALRKHDTDKNSLKKS